LDWGVGGCLRQVQVSWFFCEGGLLRMGGWRWRAVSLREAACRGSGPAAESLLWRSKGVSRPAGLKRTSPKEDPLQSKRPAESRAQARERHLQLSTETRLQRLLKTARPPAEILQRTAKRPKKSEIPTHISLDFFSKVPDETNRKQNNGNAKADPGSGVSELVLNREHREVGATCEKQVKHAGRSRPMGQT